jgi:ABC-type cobalamin/Fe3+-siderophores transport system ATPase subunit
MLHKIAKEDHIPAIVSLHQVELARRFANRIIGLAKGKVIFDGDPENLTQDRLFQIYGCEMTANGEAKKSANLGSSKSDGHGFEQDDRSHDPVCSLFGESLPSPNP